MLGNWSAVVMVDIIVAWLLDVGGISDIFFYGGLWGEVDVRGLR